MTEWTKVRLGNIIKTNQNTYSLKEKWNFINYLDTSNITMNVIDKIQYINTENDTLPSRARRKVEKNDIIYSTVRPNQTHCGIIKDQPINFLVSTGFIVINVDSKVAIPDYIYYVLTQHEVTEYLQSIAEQSVSTYPSIKPSDIENLIILLPDFNTQKRIVSIINVIDEKIKLNTTINDNLQQQMSAIYKKMFSYVLQGNTSTVEQIIAFSNGKKRPDEKGDIPVYGGNGILAYTNKFNSNKCIIIGRVGAYCGNVSYSPKECWVSDNAIEAKSKISASQLFVYHLLKNAELPSRHIGTGQPLMTQGILNTIPCSLPAPSEINAFNDLCEPLQQLVDSNLVENTQLAALRDIILPKLISGELSISNIEI